MTVWFVDPGRMAYTLAAAASEARSEAGRAYRRRPQRPQKGSG